MSAATQQSAFLASLLPSLKQYDVSSKLTVGRMRASGGFADVYDGQLRWSRDLSVRGENQCVTQDQMNEGARELGTDPEATIKSVAVKRFRIFLDTEKDFAQAIARELRVWSQLNHRNVLPFLGFTMVDDTFPAFVSEWMVNGTVKQYMAKCPDTDVIAMAAGIADGLAYLHANGVIHSDLKSDNILVTCDGHPVLSDFGVSRIRVESVTVTGTTTLKGNVRWMAIELIDPRITSAALAGKPQFHTRATDVWAYGMVLYELLSGNVPFHEHVTEASVMMALISDKLPQKPADSNLGIEDSNSLWSLCEKCWGKHPNTRPAMSEVLENLRGIGVCQKKRCCPQIAELSAHRAGVTSLAFRTGWGDFDLLASSSDDNTICVWSLLWDRHRLPTSPPALIKRLIGHTGMVTSICLWASYRLISGSWDNTIRMWDVESGECMLVTEAKHVGGIRAIACSSSGQGRVVSGGSDKRLYVWDVGSGSVVKGPLEGHTGIVTAVTYSPRGEYILSGSGDRSVIVWDADNGSKLFGPLVEHSNWVTSISCHPFEDAFVTGSSDKTITIWSMKSFTPIHRRLCAHKDQVNAVEYSPDGRFISSASRDGTVRLWDPVHGRVLSSAMRHGQRNAGASDIWRDRRQSVTSVAFSSYETGIASAGLDGRIVFWEYAILYRDAYR